MALTTSIRNRLLVCQYWVTAFRLLDAFYIFSAIEYQLSQTYPKIQVRTSSVNLLSSQLGGDYFWGDRRIMLIILIELALWTVLIFNDCYILTMDFRRTNSYLGSTALQAVVSFVAIGLTFTALGLYVDRFGWEPIIYEGAPRHGIGPFVFGIPIALGALSSLCLLTITVWPMFRLRSHLSLRWLWTCNTKDIFTESTTYLKQPRELRIFGHPRNPPASVFYVPRLTGRALARLIAPMLFRRVRPVETRGYALVRNLFALSALGIILFRTVTALLQAQNKIETRMKSRDCSEPGYQPKSHDIQVLAEYDSEIVSTKISFEDSSTAGLGPIIVPCTPLLPELMGVTWVRQIFSCRAQLPQLPVFRVAINSTSGSALTEAGTPRIWLSNKNEAGKIMSFEKYEKCAVRTYLPAWRLRPGFHIEAEAKLITRRFIQSSVLRDIVLHSDSVYTQRSLYPIVETDRVPLTDTTGSVNALATATIRVTLSPGFQNLFRGQEDFWNPKKTSYDSPPMCDYIEDYRSGSVLDVLGSVGGLFALLHAAHTLLFGRPLLWGLTGAKLITPFGLLGIFSSEDFKKRLREQYYHQSAQDDPESFRIGAFLRDFVIDLGPADIRLNRELEPEVPSNDNNQGDRNDSQMYDIIL